MATNQEVIDRLRHEGALIENDVFGDIFRFPKSWSTIQIVDAVADLFTSENGKYTKSHYRTFGGENYIVLEIFCDVPEPQTQTPA